MWMQARKTLMRWLHVVQTGAALAIMLSAKTDPELDALARIGGWRKEIKPSTPGLVKQALAGAFVHFAPLPLLRIETQSASKNGSAPTTRSPPAGQSHMKNLVGGSTQRNPYSEQRNAPTRVPLRSGTLDPS